MLALKLALAPVSAFAGALVAGADVNTYMALLLAVVAIGLGPRYLRVRDLRTQIEGLQGALATEHTIKQTDESRREQLEEDLRGAQQRANVAEKLLSQAERLADEWRARYDERTAGASLAEVKEVLQEMAKQQAKRDEMIDRQLNKVIDRMVN